MQLTIEEAASVDALAAGTPETTEDEIEVSGFAVPNATAAQGNVSLRPYQKEAIGNLIEIANEGAGGALCISATGTGKCFRAGTQVLMFDGSVRAVEDVQTGDLLMGPDSQPRQVLGTTSGRGEMFEVKPTKGTPYYVNREHILSLKLSNEGEMRGGRVAGSVINISVDDYLKQSKTFKHVAKGWRTGVDFKPRPVDLDPYFLGLWLGDGTSRTQEITTFDVETVAFLDGYAAACSMTLVKRSAGLYSITHGIKGKANVLLNQMRALNLFQNKHVPLAYKANSHEVRLQVLAGLIDSDGTPSCGGYDLVFKVKQLAEDTAFLARSLGMAAYVKECRKTCSNTGVEGTYYRVSISGDTSCIPVKIARKQNAARKQIKSVLVTGIQVTPCSIGDYYGFEVDGDHLFLLSDFTVTHNSVMLAELANRYVKAGHGVLMLVHRDELIRQLVNSCGRVGLPVGVEKAQERALPAFRAEMVRTVCASVQSLRGDRLAAWDRDAFGLIIVDEAHHIIGRTYLDVLRHFGWREEGAPFVAGFTATADRLDKRNIGSVFDGGKAFEYNLRNAVRDGYLCKLKAVTLETEPPIDLRDLKTTGGKDFSAAELEEVITASLNSIVNAIAESEVPLGTRRAIAFTPDVASSQMLADALSKVGITANWVSGACKDRSEKLKAHQNGEFQVLCNCMLAVEGYDDPAISAVILCRPTKSRGLFSQQVGRGTRLFPGKTDCLVFDFDWLTTTHDLIKAVDLYDDGSIPDEVMEIARELQDEAGERDLEAVLEAADSIHRERVKERIRRQKIPVKAGMFDPLGLCEFFDIPVHKQGYDWQNVRVASPKQIQLLRDRKVAAPDDMPFAVASKMISTIVERGKHGWASINQINALIESGVDGQIARGMRKEEASKYLEANPLPPTGPQQNLLRKHGYSANNLAAMTRKQASELIGKIKGN